MIHYKKNIIYNMKFSTVDLKTGVICLAAVMVGLAVHQIVVAPRLTKMSSKTA